VRRVERGGARVKSSAATARSRRAW
jgi:hypothetical protein